MPDSTNPDRRAASDRISSQLGRLLGRRDPGHLVETLLSGAGLAFLAQGAGFALKYLLQILFARWLGPGEFGAYTFAFTWGQVLAVPAALGLTTGALRFVPRYEALDQRPLLVGFIRRARQLPLLAGVTLTTLGTITVFAVEPPRYGAATLALGMLLVPLIALVNVQAELLRGFRRMLLAFVPQLVMVPASALTIAGASIVLTGQLSGTTALVSMVAALVATAAVQHRRIGRTAPSLGDEEAPRYQMAEWMRVSLPLMLISGSLILLNTTDILMVGMLRGPVEAGIYAAAARTANVASFALSAVNAMVAPMISSLHARGDFGALRRLVRSARRAMLVPSLVLCGGMVVFAEDVLTLFGPEFVRARWALTLLAVGQLINAATGPVGYLMSLLGHERRAAVVNGCAAITNVCLNLLLIPRYGLLGAATATMTTVAARNVSLLLMVKLHLRL